MLIFFVAALETNRLLFQFFVFTQLLDREAFPVTFSKMNTVKDIFQGIYWDFKQFSIACNNSRRLSNGGFVTFRKSFR